MGGTRQHVPDAYGRRRRPLGLVLGVAVVLAVGIVGGAVLGRLTAPQPTRTPAPATSPITSGVPGLGPTTVVEGIPIGYPRTREGAAQAAGNYLAALGGRLALDTGRATAALDRIAEPSSRDRLEKGLTASLQGEEALWGIQTAARQGQRVIVTQTPIAYRIDAFTPDEATVRVWTNLNVGVDNRQRLVAFFAIGQATLTWLNDDWRLRAFDAGHQEGDVVPACLQTPTATGGVPAKLDGFVPYGG